MDLINLSIEGILEQRKYTDEFNQEESDLKKNHPNRFQFFSIFSPMSAKIK
jgi:hypothetical protein